MAPSQTPKTGPKLISVGIIAGFIGYYLFGTGLGIAGAPTGFPGQSTIGFILCIGALVCVLSGAVVLILDVGSNNKQKLRFRK